MIRENGIAVLMTAVLAHGCGGSTSSISGLLDAEQAESTASAAHTSAAIGSLALQASLHQIDPANFAPLTAPPSVSATGDAASGTVTVDFGAGTDVNNATVAGIVTADYTVSGASVSITVTPSGLTTDTSAGGSTMITGSITLTATLNSTSNITGTLSGTLTADGPADTTTITPALTWAIDGTPTTGEITLDGTIGLDSSTYGDWTATLTALTGTLSQATRAIDSGTLAMDRNSFPSITATMVFTGLNSGTIDVFPSGYSRSFTL